MTNIDIRATHGARTTSARPATTMRRCNHLGYFIVKHATTATTSESRDRAAVRATTPREHAPHGSRDLGHCFGVRLRSEGSV
jgi:hypothetical protein